MTTNNGLANHHKSSNCYECWVRNYSVFKDCPKELFTGLFSKKQLMQFDKDEKLLKQNDVFHGVFCINEGVIKVSSFGNNNKEFILWFARPGDIIGLDSFLNNENISFSAQAIEPVKACFIPSGDLKELISKMPVVARKLMSNMCDKINFIEQRISSISKKKLQEQFAEMLISMSMKNKNTVDSNPPIHYSAKDLANIIGTTKNHIYKILSDFNAKNVIAIQNSKIVIKDFNKLSLIAIGDEFAN